MIIILSKQLLLFVIILNTNDLQLNIAQSAVKAVEYTDCTSAEW